MDDLTKKRLAQAIKALPNQKTPETSSPRPIKPKRISKIVIVAASVIAAALLGAWQFFIFEQGPSAADQAISIVPTKVSSQVSFPIPYPEEKKLPAGYKLNVDSFSGTNQAVVYSIAYNQDKLIAITVQKKPSDDEIRAFYAKQIPIRNEVKVPMGTAAIGIINNQTFASLPTEGDAWLLITAPKDIDQNDFKKVLRAINKGG